MTATIRPTDWTPPLGSSAASVIAPDKTRKSSLAGKKVHFIGIGGCGMAGLAQIAQEAGANITGTDQKESPTLNRLRSRGISVSSSQTASSIPPDCDIVVATAAIPAQHPELQEAHKRQLPVYKYAQMLGQLMRAHQGVAIAGTHGKSSTTCLTTQALIGAGLDPSFIVGAQCQQIGGGSRTGKTDILVAESCEYDRSFHHFHPQHAIILNVEADHLEYYGSLEKVVEAFNIFAKLVPENGSVLIHHECEHRAAITAGVAAVVETIGFAPEADWQVRLLTPNPESSDPRATTELWHQGEKVAHWHSPLPGKHMAYNAAVAAVTAHRLGADWRKLSTALEQFRGLDRRMQFIGERIVGKQSAAHAVTSPGDSGSNLGMATVVDDYAHHPTEIAATLEALRSHYQPRRLICVFQPHQHSRTRLLLDGFASSFAGADRVLIPAIYAVRDAKSDLEAVSSKDLVARLERQGIDAEYHARFDTVVKRLEALAEPGDLIVTMGAGDVHKVARKYLDAGSA